MTSLSNSTHYPTNYETWKLQPGLVVSFLKTLYELIVRENIKVTAVDADDASIGKTHTCSEISPILSVPLRERPDHALRCHVDGHRRLDGLHPVQQRLHRALPARRAVSALRQHEFDHEVHELLHGLPVRLAELGRRQPVERVPELVRELVAPGHLAAAVAPQRVADALHAHLVERAPRDGIVEVKAIEAVDRALEHGGEVVQHRQLHHFIAVVLEHLRERDRDDACRRECGEPVGSAALLFLKATSGCGSLGTRENRP